MSQFLRTAQLAILIIGIAPGLQSCFAQAGQNLNSLIEQLRKPDTSYSACYKLAKMKSAAAPAVPYLNALLSDPTRERDAAYALGCIGPASAPAVPRLAALVRVTPSRYKYCFIQPLGWIGPGASSAVPSIIYALSDADVMNRRAAAEALGKIGSQAISSDKSLRQMLARETDISARREAEEALMKIHSDHPLSTLEVAQMRTPTAAPNNRDNGFERLAQTHSNTTAAPNNGMRHSALEPTVQRRFGSLASDSAWGRLQNSASRKSSYPYSHLGYEPGTKPPANSGDNLIADGGFEVGLTVSGRFTNQAGSQFMAWSVKQGSVDVDQKHAPEGKDCIDMGGKSAIAQTISTSPGGSYILTFLLARDSSCAPGTKRLLVKAGRVSKEFDCSEVPDSWTQMSFNFEATSAKTEIEFESLDSTTGMGPLIDAVKVRLAN
jgi:hypothetical protein